MAAGLLVALLSACGSTVAGGAGGNSTGPSATPAPTGDDRLRAQRASQLLDRYTAAQQGADSPALDLGDQLTQEDGDWEPAVAGNAKQAVYSGHLVAVAALPPAPGKGKVLTGSGGGVSTTVMSADDALAAMTAVRSDCGGCTDLRVTGATLTSMTLRNSAGEVTVPAWRFTLEGTAVTLLRVAVPASGLVHTPVEWPLAPTNGLYADSFELTDGGRVLRVTFTGKPEGSGPCGGLYRGESYESDRAVVVGVVEVPQEPARTDVACTAIGAIRTVDVHLEHPLAQRTVLSLADGHVVVQGSSRTIGTPAR